MHIFKRSAWLELDTARGSLDRRGEPGNAGREVGENDLTHDRDQKHASDTAEMTGRVAEPMGLKRFPRVIERLVGREGCERRE